MNEKLILMQKTYVESVTEIIEYKMIAVHICIVRTSVRELKKFLLIST